MGDDIQAIKAGILEIGDILVVNKADQPGAENAVRALQVMLEMDHGSAWNRFPAGKHLRSSSINSKIQALILLSLHGSHPSSLSQQQMALVWKNWHLTLLIIKPFLRKRDYGRSKRVIDWRKI